MTEKEVRAWLKKEGTTDAWFTSENGNVSDQPVKLHDILERNKDSTHSIINILHASQTTSKDPAWVELELASILTERERKKIEEGNGFHLGLLIQLVVITIIFGAVLFYFYRPQDEKVYVKVDPLEQALNKIDEVRASGELEQDSNNFLPTLYCNIAVTDRFVFVSNLGQEEWPKCEVSFEAEEGFTYKIGKAMKPLATFQIPLRDILNKDESKSLEGQSARYVIVNVPGYRPMKEILR